VRGSLGKAQIDYTEIAMTPIDLDTAATRIAARATDLDRSGAWPETDLVDLKRADVLPWAIPGDDAPTLLKLHQAYERIAAASVSTALIWTQRDAAVDLIAGSTASACREELLDQATDRWFTVGIAQLTTSRQGGTPAVAATPVAGGWQLSGTIPWCTGGPTADVIVAGAALPDRRHILVALDRTQPGVIPGPPMELVALRSTHTSEVRLDKVFVAAHRVLRPPAATVLNNRHTSLTLGQTFIATGLCRSALNLIATHDSDRGRAAFARLDSQLESLRTEVRDLSQPGREPDATAANARLRGACNDLAVRSTHTAVALFKGASLQLDHPAQRLAREAMFLLVWSCPNPVIDCTVDLLTG
jgi:alkylation response protein AidB-like acyl-CoA dehydrogenase